MSELIRRRMLTLVAVLLLMNGSVAMVSAQVSGGGKDSPETEEEEGSQSGPCWTTDRTDVIEAEEAGLVGNRAYESPQFGYTVDWSRDWVLDDYFETPVISKESEELDALCLWLDDDALYGYVYVVGQTASRGGPDADLEEWTDADYIREQWPLLDASVVIGDADRTSAVVVYSLEDPETGDAWYTTYLSIEQTDDSMIYITVVSDAASFEDVYQLVAEDVLVDGESMFSVLDWEDIEAEL